VSDPKSCAEAPINVQGVAPDADGDWIASTVTHMWDYSEGAGERITIEAEYGIEEKDDKGDAKKKKTTKSSTSSSSTKGRYVSVLDR
jgi:hypothetical protein